MKRGDIVIAAPPSPFNKPRPTLVVQARVINGLENITVALITSDLIRLPALRIPIAPTTQNGLRKPSEVMIDHLQTVPILRLGDIVGSAEAFVMLRVDEALRVFLGL